MNSPEKKEVMQNSEQDGIKVATKIVNEILNLAVEYHLDDLELLCRNVFGDQGKSSVVRDTTSLIPRKTFLSMISQAISSVQSNPSIRFRKANEKKSIAFQAVRNSGPSRDYEDITSVDILEAPICEIILVQRGDVIPSGFYRIGKIKF